jgi:nitronate monooxygenase
MSADEYASLLNELLEAERAGARLLAAWMDELPAGAAAWAGLQGLQREEARNCSVLIHLLLEAGAEPSARTGGFYDKGLAIGDWEERLDFLARGQAWVARRIAAALPGLPAGQARRLLQSMHDSHLAGTPAELAPSNCFLRT